MKIKKINLTEDSVKVYVDSEGNLRSSETGQIIEPEVWTSGDSKGAEGAGEGDPLEGSEGNGEGEKQGETKDQREGQGQGQNNQKTMGPPDFWEQGEGPSSSDPFVDDGNIYRMNGKTWVQNKNKPGDFREYVGPYNEVGDDDGDIIIEQ